MQKTVLHAIVALVLWFGVSALGVAVEWRITAVVAGAVAVHLFWEHVVFNPFLYLGAMPVSNDDPIMLDARAKARQTLPLFLTTIFPAHRQDALIKFAFTTSSGGVENLWADLLDVDGHTLKVYVRTPPVHHDQPMDRQRFVEVADVLDWQVEYADGTLRGGFTTRALFKIFEREEGYVHAKFRSQIARFREVDGDQAAP